MGEMQLGLWVWETVSSWGGQGYNVLRKFSQEWKGDRKLMKISSDVTNDIAESFPCSLFLLSTCSLLLGYRGSPRC